jgi:recombination protein RecR
MIDLNNMITVLSKIPGIGKKSASRISYYLVKNKSSAYELSNVIKETIDNIINCSICGNFTIKDPCVLCSANNRDDDIICVVEDPRDLQAIEDLGLYKGRYHVLMGVINPLEGIGPEKIRIKELLNRINSKHIREVLVATNPTIEGEATFIYISNLLSKFDTKISRLATGIPIGGSLEYSDKLTLRKALESKQYLQK